MHIEEVQPRGCAPVAQQTRLDMSPLERDFEQRVVLEINLPNGQVIG